MVMEMIQYEIIVAPAIMMNQNNVIIKELFYFLPSPMLLLLTLQLQRILPVYRTLFAKTDWP